MRGKVGGGAVRGRVGGGSSEGEGGRGSSEEIAGEAVRERGYVQVYVLNFREPQTSGYVMCQDNVM